jgi:hypothetical protein
VLHSCRAVRRQHELQRAAPGAIVRVSTSCIQAAITKRLPLSSASDGAFVGEEGAAARTFSALNVAGSRPPRKLASTDLQLTYRWSLCHTGPFTVHACAVDASTLRNCCLMCTVLPSIRATSAHHGAAHEHENKATWCSPETALGSGGAAMRTPCTAANTLPAQCTGYTVAHPPTSTLRQDGTASVLTCCLRADHTDG